MDVRELPTPLEIIAHLDRRVHGQVRAKRDLAVAVFNHYIGQAARNEGGTDFGMQHILLLGPTGVGKTYLVRTLAEFLEVPVAICSATGLAEVGFKGDSVTTLVRTLLDRAGGRPRLAEKGIIFIDEIDKIKRADTFGTRDITGEGVTRASDSHPIHLRDTALPMTLRDQHTREATTVDGRIAGYALERGSRTIREHDNGA